jgi:hypothetical protein
MWGLVIILILSLTGSAVGATRLGLHVTAEERDRWNQRLSSGPYRVLGDVRPNSPGDWNKIFTNAQRSAAELAAERNAGYTGAGCVANGTELPYTWAMGVSVRDMALWYLLTGNATARDKVIAELTAQEATAGTDFTNTSKWCISMTCCQYGDPDNLWNAALWLARMIYTYDYLKAGASVHGFSLNSTFTNNMDAWIAAGANFFYWAMRTNLDQFFTNRQAGTYTLSATGTNFCNTSYTCCNAPTPGRVWFNGPQTWLMPAYYSNRRATMAIPIAQIGVMQNNATFTNEAKRIFQEFIRFAPAPGTHQNTEVSLRWGNDTTGQIQYGMTTYGALVQIADMLARNGDTSLYDYSTSLGTGGGSCDTSGYTKSLLTTLIDYANMLDHTVIRYQNLTTQTDPWIKDSVSENSGCSSVGDHFLAQANLYYRNNYLKTIYMRTAPGQNGYTTPGYEGNHCAGYYEWGSSWHTLPGVLGMWGQLDGVVDPYNLSEDTLAPGVPTSPAIDCSGSTTTCLLDATKPALNATGGGAYDDPGGYRIRYCSGAACSLPTCPHAQCLDVADTDNLVDYQLTGLSADTLYRVGISAYDDNGNVGAEAATVEGTTDAAPPAALVAHYQFASDASDSSTFGHDGTLQGDAAVSGGELVLDGTGDYVVVTRTDDLEPAIVTVCAEVTRSGAQDAFADIVNKTWQNDSAPTYESYGLHITGANSDLITFYTGFSGSGHSLSTLTSVLPGGVATHVCGRYDPTAASNQKAIFINGQLNRQLTDITSAIAYSATNSNLYLGWGTLAGRFFQGSIDNVRIYNGALSDEAIAALAVGDPDPDPVGVFAQTDWCWEQVESPETKPCLRGSQKPGRIVENNNTILRTAITRTVDISPLTEFQLYCRVPFGSGATQDWWALDTDCVGKPFCYGFDTLASGKPLTNAKLVAANAFQQGGRLYEHGDSLIDQVSVGIDLTVERRHVIRASPGTAVETTIGCCERLSNSTELDSCSEARGVVVRPTGRGW